MLPPWSLANSFSPSRSRLECDLFMVTFPDYSKWDPFFKSLLQHPAWVLPRTQCNLPLFYLFVGIHVWFICHTRLRAKSCQHVHCCIPQGRILWALGQSWLIDDWNPACLGSFPGATHLGMAHLAGTPWRQWPGLTCLYAPRELLPLLTP